MLKRFTRGDEINILAPSSFIDKKEDFALGIDILKTWGLKVISNNILSKKYSYLPKI